MPALGSASSQSCAFSSLFYVPEKKSNVGKNVDRLFSVTSTNRKSWTADAPSTRHFYCGFWWVRSWNNPSSSGINVNYLIPKSLLRREGKHVDVCSVWKTQRWWKLPRGVQGTATEPNIDQVFPNGQARAWAAKGEPGTLRTGSRNCVYRETGLLQEPNHLVEDFIFGI